MDKFIAYLQQALDSFDGDPADSKFQQGYEAALREVAKQYLLLTEDGSD